MTELTLPRTRTAALALLTGGALLSAVAVDRYTVSDRDPRAVTVTGGTWYPPTDARPWNAWELTVTDDETGSSLTYPAERDAAASAKRGDHVTLVTRRGIIGLTEEKVIRATEKGR